jgi:integrase
VIYKRGGCDKNGPNGVCSKCGKRRGSCGVYWFKFMFNGKLVRVSTRQGNDDIARDMQAAERNRLATESKEKEVAMARRNCTEVLRCPECLQWFDAATTITESASGQQFCSNFCRENWKEKRKIVPTLAEFCDKRVEPWAKSTYEKTTPKTWLWYLFGLNTLRKSRLANRKLDEIGFQQIADFASEKQADGLQVSSVNSCLRALRRVLHLAGPGEHSFAIIKTVPKVKMLPGERHRERVVTAKEEARYLAVALPLLQDVSVVLFDTGMRPEECHRMRWEHINWAGGRNGTVFIDRGKSKAARRLLPMSIRLRRMLENRWTQAGEPSEGWVWPAETKEGHINHDSLKSQHRKALALSKVRAFEIYSIRHTFLTRLGESGCDVWTLARIAGHSQISMSQQYVHPQEDAVMNMFSRMGGHDIGHSENPELPESKREPGASDTNQQG